MCVSCDVIEISFFLSGTKNKYRENFKMWLNEMWSNDCRIATTGHHLEEAERKEKKINLVGSIGLRYG